MGILEFARPDVVTAPLDAHASEAAKRMRSHGVGSVVVVDEDDQPKGIVTDRDLAVDVLGRSDDPDVVKIRQIMTPDPVTVSANASVPDVLQRMDEQAHRRIPVVDGRELVGIVTLDDLIVLVARELDHAAGVIATESPAW